MMCPFLFVENSLKLLLPLLFFLLDLKVSKEVMEVRSFERSFLAGYNRFVQYLCQHGKAWLEKTKALRSETVDPHLVVRNHIRKHVHWPIYLTGHTNARKLPQTLALSTACTPGLNNAAGFCCFLLLGCLSERLRAGAAGVQFQLQEGARQCKFQPFIHSSAS